MLIDLIIDYPKPMAFIHKMFLFSQDTFGIHRLGVYAAGSAPSQAHASPS